MKKNKDNIFGKVWGTFLVCLLGLGIYSTMVHTKNTFAASTLYGIYAWTNNFNLNDEGEFNINFKSGGYNLDGSNVIIKTAENINYNKMNITYEVAPYLSGMQVVGAIGNRKVFYDDTQILGYRTISLNNGSFNGGFAFINDDSGLLTLDFGTSGTNVTRVEEYACGVLWLGKCSRNVAADDFVQMFEQSTTKVNACYLDSNGMMHWGHGSQYLNGTLVPNLYNRSLCEGVVPLIVTSGESNLSCNSNNINVVNLQSQPSLCVADESGKKVTLYLFPGEYVMRDLDFTVSNSPSGQSLGYKITNTYKDGSLYSYDYNGSLYVRNDYSFIEAEATYVTKHTVRFEVDGKVVATRYVVSGEYFDDTKKPDDPVKSGYDFLYWELNGSRFYFKNEKIVNDITLKAKFKDTATVKFCVNFYDNRKDASPNLYGRQCVERKDYLTEIRNPEMDGYKFNGWLRENYGTDEFSLITDITENPVTYNMNLYANWIKLYNVDFVSNGGTPVPSQVVEENGTVQEPLIPFNKDKGYVFDYWKLSSTGGRYDFNTPVTCDMELIAVWKINDEPGSVPKPSPVPVSQYSITYMLNGGKSGPKPTYFNDKARISLLIPERDGYVFNGWNDKTDCSGLEYSRGKEVVKTNLVLYACWKEESSDNDNQCAFKNTTK